MSPKAGEEVYLTALEIALIRVFENHLEALDDGILADHLDILSRKLRGTYKGGTTNESKVEEIKK